MKPPRIAAWLLHRLLDAESAEAISGDLAEEFGRRREADGAGTARRWYWRQTIASVSTRLVRRRSAHPEVAATRGGWMNGFTHDLRFAFRSFAKAPAFTVAAVMTLAIGMGAATAIATAAHRALLQPLPFTHGDRLVLAGHEDEQDPGTVSNVGWATVIDWRARMKTLDELAIIRGWQPTLVGGAGTERLAGLRVNWNFFRTLGVQPALGRDFRADEDRPDHWRVVVISDGLWRRHFGARVDAVGTFIELGGRKFEIVGVLPAAYEPLISQRFYERAEIWAPLGYGPSDTSACRTCQHLKLVGRLAPGATIDRARTELAVVHAGLKREHPNDYTDASPLVSPLDVEISRSIRRPLQVLMGAVVFVLLVAAANVAGLILARATEREREIATRGALGASRSRLVRQLLTESLVLAIAAGAIGTLLARLGLAFLSTRAPVTVPRLDQAAGDPTVIAIGLAIALAALVAFGLIPALTASRSDLQAVLREGRHSTAKRAARAREILMAGELAVALVLVAAAGLMYRTVDRLLDVDPGFDAHGVLSVGVSIVGPRWAEDDAVRMFHEDLLRRATAIPGVEHAALAGQVPLGGNYDRWGFRIEGRTLQTGADAPSVERYSVSPDYFATMKIPLKRGRLFTETDRNSGPLVMIIGETTARTLFPGQDPIGIRVRIGGPDGPWRTIVGIVGDVRHYALSDLPTTQFYLPQKQVTDSFLIVVARTSGEPSALAMPIRQAVAAIAPELPVYDIATLGERVSRNVASRRFLMLLLGLFAVATLMMTAIGLYGVTSQAVAGRRREFGIRVALGARRADIYGLVLRRGLRLVGIGVAAGLAGVVVVGRLLGSQLYETAPTDPLTLGLAAVVLLGAALAAHVVPLRRASGVQPALTLRGE